MRGMRAEKMQAAANQLAGEPRSASEIRQFSTRMGEAEYSYTPANAALRAR